MGRAARRRRKASAAASPVLGPGRAELNAINARRTKRQAGINAARQRVSDLGGPMLGPGRRELRNTRFMSPTALRPGRDELKAIQQAKRGKMLSKGVVGAIGVGVIASMYRSRTGPAADKSRGRPTGPYMY